MWSEDWLLYHKVVFDGINKLVIIVPGEDEVDVKVDIYSSWKEWVRLRDNAKFEPAIRVSGGDPITGTALATGDVYFMISGWRIYISDTCKITGVIYSDDYPSPFTLAGDAKLVTNSVSNLVQSLGFNGTVNTTVSPNVTAQDIWDYLLSGANVSGSAGNRLKKLLTLAEFIGLK